MKTLYIMRHGKKEIKNINDYEINLLPEGIKKTEELAKKLKKDNINPDLILASPSKRTRQTAQIIANELDYDKNIHYNEVLYQAFLNELIEVITYTFDNINTLFLIGHNPSLASFAFSFIKFKQKFEMGAVLKIQFNVNSWLDIKQSNARFISYNL